MRPLSVQEIDQILESVDVCVGKPLQTVVASGTDVVLGFWDRRTLWIWFDANPSHPTLLPMLDLPISPPAKKSPLQLFLKAHFSGRHLRGVERPNELGRIAIFHFEGGAELEFRLIPRAVNCIARAGDKQISMHVVHELALSHDIANPQARTLRDLLEEWKATRGGKREVKSPRAQLEKKLESARKSIERVQVEIATKESSPYRRLGDWLVQNQTLDVPAEFAPLIDSRRKLAWNIEQCFNKAKEAERKLEGTRARLGELQSHVADFEKRLVEGRWLEEPQRKKTPKSDLPNARTLHLAENFQITVGKSAADNLDLLRRARAWDVWMHVKDRPSAHAILFRPKGAKVGDDMLKKAAQWLVRMSLGAKYKQHDGEKFQILTAECRHVSPIKGDRVGRVTYRNERTFGIQFDAT